MNVEQFEYHESYEDYEGDEDYDNNIIELDASSYIERFTWHEGGTPAEIQYPIVRILDPEFQIEDNKVGDEFVGEEEIRHSILEALYGEEFIRDMVSVKLPTQAQYLTLRTHPDGVEREIAFSTTSQAFLLRPEAKTLIDEFFSDQPDTATRYGSLLTTDCYHKTERLSDVVVKVVDYENSKHREMYRIGDCRGLISTRLAAKLHLDFKRPFQFRMAWRRDWSNSNCRSPEKSFLAKGTLAAADLGNVDIILDQSSIKGNKIECGMYKLPELVLGIKSLAKICSYKNSWQINQWFSGKAITADVLPETIKKVEELAERQQVPRKFINYLIEEEKTKYQDEKEDIKSKTLRILEADKLGQLETHPKIVDFLGEQVQQKWMDLAINGGVRHFAGLAQPDYRLKANQVCIPELPHGEQIIITRYPIVNSDGIRKYVNIHIEDLKDYQGCVFIHPDVAMANHQCDFDGDMLVFNYRENLPTIWWEILWGGDPPKWEPVKKRDKIPYQGTLARIAIQQADNKIGLLATAIGQVNCSNAGSLMIKDKVYRKEDILNRLFDALQIEVDSAKSALRAETVYPWINDIVRAWTKLHPVSLFQNKSNSEVFRSTPGVWNEKLSINILARETAARWQQVRFFKHQVNHFAYLFPYDRNSRYSQQMLNLLDEYYNEQRRISKQYGENPKLFIQEIGKLYERLKSKRIESLEAAAVLWQYQHSRQVKQNYIPSLVFNLYEDYIIEQLLKNPTETTMIGKQYNALSEMPLNNEDLILTVDRIESDEEKYMDAPGLYLGEYLVGMFGQNNPKFGIGTTLYVTATDIKRTTKLVIERIELA